MLKLFIYFADKLLYAKINKRINMIRKSVFITGASGDIGAKLVERFAQNGYDVVATYNNGSIEKLKNICAKLNVDFKSYKMNIENVEEIESCFKESFKTLLI